MIPLWVVANRQVKTKLSTRETPLLALGSAFSFTIMLFNIPAPGGTTAHAVGATLLAILMGPWAALIGVSVALAVQALFFGDGGLWAFGANCFTMAFVQPFVGYTVYRLCRYLWKKPKRGDVLAGAVGAYMGINAGALTVAVLLGIQPAIYHTADGKPLYFPFGLSITIPIMLAIHLLVAGVAEAVITALVVQSAEALNLPLFDTQTHSNRTASQSHSTRWILLCTLLALSPLGLIAQGSAWGEWDRDELKREITKHTGRTGLPSELEKADAHSYRGLAALQKYGGDKGTWAYIGSGFLGVGAIAGIFAMAGRRFRIRKNPSQMVTQIAPNKQTTGHLPEWLLHSSYTDRPCLPASAIRPALYLERTLQEITEAMSQIAYGQNWSELEGFLQSLNARAKLLGVVGLILLTGTTRSISTLLFLGFTTLGLAAASKIPLSILIKRSIRTVALFGAAITLPPLLLALYQHNTSGQIQAITLLLRLTVVVTLSSLIPLTTRWNDLLTGLRRLGVPRSATTLIAMSYRYLLLSLQTANEMFLARKSRVVGRDPENSGRQFVGFSTTAFFGKTLRLAEEIHQALVSRNFQGDFYQMTPMRWRVRDSIWLITVVAIIVWIRR